MATMRYGTWHKTFQPIPNTLQNPKNEHIIFETFGKDLEFVKKAEAEQPGCVWTLVDCDGKLRITDGMHFVNRMGYIVTRVSYNGDTPHDIAY